MSASRVLAQSGEAIADVRPATAPTDAAVEPSVDTAPPVDAPTPEDGEREPNASTSEEAATTSGSDDESLDDTGGYGAQASVQLGVVDPPPRATSDFELDIDAYRIVPRRTAAQLLTLAPGLVVANHGGIGHGATTYLRGFDAGEGQDVGYEVDGVLLNEPSNPHGNGYADPGFLPVEIVRRVVVREGPFDPRQPSYTVAASFRYELGASERGLRFGFRYGSFHEWRVLAVYAPPGEDDGTFIAADAVGGDGFGPNRAHQSFRAIGRIERHANGISWSLLGAASGQSFDSAGVIPEAAYRTRSLPCAKNREAQFFCLVDPNQGGSGQRELVLGRVSFDRPGWTFEQTAYVMFRDDRFREDFTGIAQNPIGDGLDQRYRALTGALRGAYRMVGRFLGARQTFEVGYLGRHDEGRTSMDRVRFSDGAPYSQVFDDDLSFTQFATYGLFDLGFSRFVTAQGGLRLEGLAAQITKHGLPTSDRMGPRLSTQTFDSFGLAVLPRGVLSIHAMPTLDVVLSAGIGTRPVDAQGLSDGERLPFTRVKAYELGVVHRLTRGLVSLVSRASLFTTTVTRDLVFDANAGRNVPIGKTNRYGTMLTTELALGTRLDARASFTWAEAHLPTPGAPSFALGAGPRLPYVPRFVGRIDVAYHDTIRVRREPIGIAAGFGATFIGKKPLPYDQLSQRITVFDAGASIRYRFVSVELLVENLFDQLYRNYELHAKSDFSPVDGTNAGSMIPQRLFAAGAPRMVFVTLTFHLDPTHFTGTSIQ